MEEFKNVEKVLNEFVNAFSELYKDELSKHRATGNLIESIKIEIDNKSSIYDIEMSLASYWKYVENGRGSGKMPPIDSIIEWIRVKQIIPQPDRNGKIPSINSLAYLIARKIGKEGTMGTGALEMTKEAIMQDFELKLINAFYKDLEENTDLIFRVLHLN